MKTGRQSATARELEEMLRSAFRKVGLRARRGAAATGDVPGIVFEKDGRKYLVELRASSEGRIDRLVPLLSQAVLQARAHAREGHGAIPIAVVGALRITASVLGQLREFAARYAADVGVGVIDVEGLRSFRGFGLETLDAKPPRRPGAEIVGSPYLPDLFSDLNQWMLKVIIGQRLPEELITTDPDPNPAPRGPIQNASHLARVARVSVMSASRFVKRLSERGFLDTHDDTLQIVRIEELLDLWISANRDSAEVIPARWNIRKGPDQLRAALREYEAPNRNTPECCLALFAAADELGYGFVHGVPADIYLKRVTLGALDFFGLVIDHSSRQPDVYIRRPATREAIFRARVMRGGIPVSDILQVWLDVSVNPARGKEQAREIQRRVLNRFLGSRP